MLRQRHRHSFSLHRTSPAQVQRNSWKTPGRALRMPHVQICPVHPASSYVPLGCLLGTGCGTRLLGAHGAGAGEGWWGQNPEPSPPPTTL